MDSIEVKPEEGVEGLFDQLCTALANDQFWGTAVGSSNDEIKAIFRSRPQRIRRRRTKFVLEEDDPRPHFVDNVVNAYNSGDIDILREILEKQYEPDCVFVQRYTKNTPDAPAHREFHTRDNMMEYLRLFIDACPDGVLVVTSRKLHIRHDGTSYLVAKLNFDAVWIFKIVLRNILTKTRNLLANFNPLSTLYNYFIAPQTTSSLLSAESTVGDDTLPSIMQYSHLDLGDATEILVREDSSLQFKYRRLDASGKATIQSRDNSNSEIVNLQSVNDETVGNNTPVFDKLQQPDDEDEKSLSSIESSLCNASPSSSSHHAPKVNYPIAWLRHDSFFAATQSAVPLWPHVLTGYHAQESQPSSSASDGINFAPSTAIISPVEVTTPETTYELIPKQQPHRVHVAVSYVAHINENYKIYKTESFVHGEFSTDWWGNYVGEIDEGF